MKKNAFNATHQHTVKSAISVEGIGLHTGNKVTLTIHPAAENQGISFLRTDLNAAKPIPACAVHVGDTQLGTTLFLDETNKVSTVEHLMAALWGLGVDNARIELNGPEVPIMDGSSKPFIALIEETGLQAQDAPRHYLEIKKPLHIQHQDSEMTLLPYDGFCVDILVEFDHPQIALQKAEYDFSQCSFSTALASARTFGFAREVEMLREMGLARGGSLKNAIVLGDDGVLNPEGLRFDDEFVRHKALDCVGDLYLTGQYIRGKIIAHKPGHTINTMMARKLLKTPEYLQDFTMSYEAPAYKTASASGYMG